MKIKPGGKITNYLTKFYEKYTSTISLNKNLLLSGSVGFIVSLIVAYLSTKYSNDDFTTSTLTVISGFISSKIIFVILFHLDNKKKYTKKLTGKLNFDILKQIVTKMIFADAIFDIINNVSRWIILYELLLIRLGPFEAAIVSSIASSFLSYLSINILSRYIKIFSPLKKKEIQKRKNFIIILI